MCNLFGAFTPSALVTWTAPPIWEDVTMHFLFYLPQRSRRHYEKLHERHWTIGHNSCKDASTAFAHRALLTCSLCSSPDRCEADTYDHVFHLCL